MGRSPVPTSAEVGILSCASNRLRPAGCLEGVKPPLAGGFCSFTPAPKGANGYPLRRRKVNSRLGGNFRLIKTLFEPYRYILPGVYVLSFILAFSGFANFGIVARQRSLMIPFFLAFLALPDPRNSRPDLITEQDRTLAHA